MKSARQMLLFLCCSRLPQSHLISARKCSHHVLFWLYKFCLLEHSPLFKDDCRQEASRFNPLLALPNAKHLCSAFSKSIGTQDISQRISDCSVQNIKHAFCFSKAGFQNRTGNKSKLKVYENRQLELYCISLCLEARSFERVQSREKIVARLLSKQDCPYMSVSLPAASQLLMAHLTPCTLLFTFLRLLPSYKSAVDAISFSIHRQLPVKQPWVIDCR